MQIPLFWFNLVSLVSSFGITLVLVWKKPKSILVLLALAVALFLLFGVFSIPGFFLALGARVLLSADKTTVKKKRKQAKL